MERWCRFIPAKSSCRQDSSGSNEFKNNVQCGTVQKSRTFFTFESSSRRYSHSFSGPLSEDARGRRRRELTMTTATATVVTSLWSSANAAMRCDAKWCGNAIVTTFAAILQRSIGWNHLPEALQRRGIIAKIISKMLANCSCNRYIRNKRKETTTTTTATKKKWPKCEHSWPLFWNSSRWFAAAELAAGQLAILWTEMNEITIHSFIHSLKKKPDKKLIRGTLRLGLWPHCRHLGAVHVDCVG